MSKIETIFEMSIRVMTSKKQNLDVNIKNRQKFLGSTSSYDVKNLNFDVNIENRHKFLDANLSYDVKNQI